VITDLCDPSVEAAFNEENVSKAKTNYKQKRRFEKQQKQQNKT